MCTCTHAMIHNAAKGECCITVALASTTPICHVNITNPQECKRLDSHKLFQIYENICCCTMRPEGCTARLKESQATVPDVRCMPHVGCCSVPRGETCETSIGTCASQAYGFQLLPELEQIHVFWILCRMTGSECSMLTPATA